jgi:hypothetical protein
LVGVRGRPRRAAADRARGERARSVVTLADM